jgi:outer membrane protein TolC
VKLFCSTAFFFAFFSLTFAKIIYIVFHIFNHRRIAVKRITTILAMLLTVGVATAETTAPRLTLKEAVNMALEQNNLIKAAGYTADASRQGIAIASSRYYPGIFLEETFSASNSPTQTFMMKLDEGRFSQNDFLISNLNHPSAHNNFKSSLTILQPLYTPSTAPVLEIATKDAEKDALGLEGVRQNVAFLVFRTYLEVEKAAAQLTAAEHAIREAKENMRLATLRNEAGIGLKSDELRARTHRAAMESQLITAGNNLVLAQMRLAVVVGIKNAARVETAENLTGISSPSQTDELVKTALENRSDLRQFRTELEKSDASVRLARSGYLPSLEGFASYQMNSENTPFGSDNDAWSAGISLKWQIFDGFRRCRERDRATAGRSAANEQLENSVKEITYQVRESLLRREEMEQRREVARHALVDAEETVRLLSRRFENSLSTMAELLDAQNALNQARASLVETEANHTLSGGQVYYAAGVFLKEIAK